MYDKDLVKEMVCKELKGPCRTRQPRTSFSYQNEKKNYRNWKESNYGKFLFQSLIWGGRRLEACVLQVPGPAKHEGRYTILPFLKNGRTSAVISKKVTLKIMENPISRAYCRKTKTNNMCFTTAEALDSTKVMYIALERLQNRRTSAAIRKKITMGIIEYPTASACCRSKKTNSMCFTSAGLWKARRSGILYYSSWKTEELLQKLGRQ